MLSTFNITQKGERHINDGTPCQDYSCSKRIELSDSEYVITAIADGVGSCKASHVAAKVSVITCVDFIAREILRICNCEDDDFVLSAINRAYEAALDHIERTAKEMGIPFNEFDTTLTCAVFNGESLWYGHIGDDGIVVLYNSGKYEMITDRHKGEEINSVYPLRRKDLWQIGKCTEKVASFALMTDGILDCCVDSAAMNARVYFPFLEPLLTASPKSEDDVEALKDDWSEFLHGEGGYQINIRKHVCDDITLAAGINSDSVDNISEVLFDIDEWDRDSLRRKKELDEKLYRVNLNTKGSIREKGTASWFIKGIKTIIGLLTRLALEEKEMSMK